MWEQATKSILLCFFLIRWTLPNRSVANNKRRRRKERKKKSQQSTHSHTHTDQSKTFINSCINFPIPHSIDWSELTEPKSVCCFVAIGYCYFYWAWVFNPFSRLIPKHNAALSWNTHKKKSETVINCFASGHRLTLWILFLSLTLSLFLLFGAYCATHHRFRVF